MKALRYGAAGSHRPSTVIVTRLVMLLVFTVSAYAQLVDGPGFATSSLADAKRLMQANRFDQAEGVLRTYLGSHPSSSEAAYALAYSLLREGKPKDSLAAYTQAAALRTPSAEDLRNVAQDYVLLEDYPEADKWLLASLRFQPNSPDSWYNLGRLRSTQNRFAEAVDSFQKALVLAPQSVKVENNLGLAYEGLNRNHDAELAYRQALAWQAAQPSTKASEQPLLNLAILLLHSPNADEVQGLLLRAASIAPKDARVHEQLGQLYLRDLKFEQAANELQQATHLDPDRANLHFLLGQALKHLGRQREATAEFASAARLTESEPRR